MSLQRPAALLVTSAVVVTSSAQQVPDTSFVARLGNAPGLRGEGPLLMRDEAHHNFHTPTA